MTESFIIPRWESFKNEEKEIYEKFKLNKNGKIADYIPELAKKKS